MPKTLANNRANYLSLPGLVDKHEYWLNQSLNSNDSPEFLNMTITGNAIIQGDLTVNGATTVISTDILEIKDNLIQINSTETSAGVSSGIAGIEIKRGTLGSYHSIFRESDDTFRVGEANFTQAVATREDSPMSNGVMIFNQAASRLDATNTIPITMNFTSNEASTTSASGTLRVTGGIGVTGTSNFDSRVYLKGTNYNNYIQTNTSEEFIVNSTSNILLNAANSNYVKVPANVSLSFGGNSHNITGTGTNVNFNSSGQISILGTSVALRSGSPLLFSTNDKITLSTDLTIDAAVSLAVNPVTKFTNTTASTTSANGAIRISGGISLSNTTDAVSFTSGGTFTTAGGLAIAKKLYVGGDSNFTNFISDTGTAKKITLGNGTGSSSICNLSSMGDFTETVATSGSTITRAIFNSFGAGTLSSSNPVTTLTSATVYIEGAPSAGTNQTINNRYALLVETGNNKMNGNLNLGSLDVTGNTMVDTITSTSSTTSNFTVSSVTKQESVTTQVFHEINAPTLTAASNFTTPISATLAISGPVAGTNQTITNPTALLVKTGNISVASNSTESINTAGGIVISNTTDATSVTNGGTFTTAGGLAIAKKLFVGGDSSMQNVNAIDITNNKSVSKKMTVNGDLTEAYSEASALIVGGSNFSDSALSGATATATSSLFKSTTFNYTSPVTVAQAATMRISQSPSAGINATFTKSYGLIVDTMSRFNTSEFSGAITAESSLSVTGLSSLAQTSISTNTGQFTIAGSNGISANVNGAVSVQGSGITLDSSAGLTLDGHSSLTLVTTGGSSMSSGTSSSISVASGTLGITAPTTTITSDTINLIGDTVNFGSSISDMVMGGNLTIAGNFTVQGTYTTINSQTVTVNDNVIVVNSMPLGISDGGLLVKRYQTPNDTNTGQIVLDTPTITGAFQSGSATPGTLVLDASSSSSDNEYRGYWIRITSGACNGYIRRLKTYNGTTKTATVYLTADNTDPITDGLDMTTVPSSGDTYELFIGAYSGLFYSETADRWVMGKVPFDNGAGTFPLTTYDDLQINNIILDGDLAFDGKLTLTATDTSALSVSNASGKILNIDTVNSTQTLYNPSNTVGTLVASNYSMKNSGGTEAVYTQLKTELASANTSKLTVNLLNSGTLQSFLEMTGTSITSTKDLVISDITCDSLSTTGSLTADTSTLGNTTTGLLLNSRTATGEPTFTTRSTGTRQVYDTQLSATKVDYAVGVSADSLYFSIPQANAGYFHSWFAGTTEIMALSGAGTLSVADLDISGNITGTWNGSTVAVAYGGTGTTSFTSDAVLLGNGTSAIQSSAMTYASSTLNLPKIVSSDTTDANSVSTGAITTAGGLGIAKSLKVGTTMSINTTVSTSDINLSGNAVISNSTVDASDNGSLSISGGGLPLDTRGSYIKMYGNEVNGNLVISAGNVSSTGTIDLMTGGSTAVSVNYNGSLVVNSALDATNTVGSIVTAGGISVAKKVYVGTDLTVIGSSSLGNITGTYQGNTISVAYGGTGASTFTSSGILIGNGSSAIQTNSNLTFASNLLTTTKISLIDATQSSSVSTGTLITAGGIGIAKNCYIGGNTVTSGNLSVGTTANSSEITVVSGGNIGVDTNLSSDTGYLSVSGSGSQSTSRGANIKLYGVDNANTGKLLLSAGNVAGGSIDLVTGSASALEINYSGIASFKNTTATSSSTSGAVTIAGGLGIAKTTDAISDTNGGALTVAGGVGIAKNCYIGGNLVVTGSISGGATISNPTLTTSSLTLISSVAQYSSTLVSTGSLRTLTIVLVAATTAAGDAHFEFVLPGVTSLSAYSVVASVSGYFSDFAIQNIITREIASTNRVRCQFTSAGVGDHVLLVNITYSV